MPGSGWRTATATCARRPRRGDRAGGRDAAHHPQRAAGRAAARLSRSVGARPARAVRLRPSGALRGADARRAWPTRSGSSRRRATPRPRRSCGAIAERLAGDARRSGLAASARAPGPQRRRCTGCGWALGAAVAARLERPERDERWLFSRLAEWEESGRAGRRRARSGRPAEARERLDQLTGPGRAARGPARYGRGGRRGVRARARRRTRPTCCSPRPAPGIGKTLAYLAPASLWAEQAGGAVWVSTFTKALQRQLDARGAAAVRRRRGARAAGSSSARAARIISACSTSRTRCRARFAGRAAILAQLVARWAAYTKDGDMVGGDLPGWLPSLFRRAGATALTDRRGECVYAGCPHYRRCFIERAERASREADIVIANHALVMVNAARGARGCAGPDRVRRGPSSVRRRRFDLRRRLQRAGGDRAAPLDRRAGGPFARPAARAGGAADGRRLL